MIDPNKTTTKVEFDVYTDRLPDVLLDLGRLANRDNIVPNTVKIEGVDLETEQQMLELSVDPLAFNPELVTYKWDDNEKMVAIMPNAKIIDFFLNYKLADKGTAKRFLTALYDRKNHSGRVDFYFAYYDQATNRVSLRADCVTTLNQLIAAEMITIRDFGDKSKKLLADLESSLYVGSHVLHAINSPSN